MSYDSRQQECVYYMSKHCVISHSYIHSMSVQFQISKTACWTGRITIIDIHNIYTDVHNCIFISHNTNCGYPKDIFASHNEFLEQLLKAAT